MQRVITMGYLGDLCDDPTDPNYNPDDPSCNPPPSGVDDPSYLDASAPSEATGAPDGTPASGNYLQAVTSNVTTALSDQTPVTTWSGAVKWALLATAAAFALSTARKKGYL
jgi:hypothetical protein